MSALEGELGRAELMGDGWEMDRRPGAELTGVRGRPTRATTESRNRRGRRESNVSLHRKTHHEVILLCILVIVRHLIRFARVLPLTTVPHLPSPLRRAASSLFSSPPTPTLPTSPPLPQFYTTPSHRLRSNMSSPTPAPEVPEDPKPLDKPDQINIKVSLSYAHPRLFSSCPVHPLWGMPRG